MDNFEILLRIAAALAFGAILGLETEKRAAAGEQQRLGGVRTYTILALYGSIGGVLYAQGNQIFAYMIFSAVLVIVLAAYILNIQQQKAFGMTTEIAILITVLLGFMVSARLVSIEILTIITVIMAFILSQKRGISAIVSKLEERELQDIIKFLIVTVLFLPFLPNRDILAAEIPMLQQLITQVLNVPQALAGQLVLINPLRTWQYVVLISGFNLGAYFAMKVAKAKGMAVAGFLGGIISSTTTTIALALKSHAAGKSTEETYAGAALIANGASFIQMLVLAYAASYAFGNAILLPSAAMGVVSLLFGGWYLWRESKSKANQHVAIEYTPYSIWPALRFALLLIAVKFLAQVAYLLLGEAGLAVSLGLSGFAGLDVTTITLSEVVDSQVGLLTNAIGIFLLVNLINFGAKSLYARFQGSRGFAVKLFIGLAVTGVAGIIATILIV